MRFPKLHRPRSLARDPCTSRRAWLSGRRWRQQMSSEFTINEGRHKIDGQLASKILDLCFWHDQQRRQRGSAERVGTKAAALRLNLFRQKTQIAFGRLGSKLYLLDGYGRLAAVKQTGIAAEFDVAIFTAADEQGLSRLWASFDEAAMQKPRGSAQTAAALGIAEEFGINHLLAKAVLSAMPTIEEGMKFRVGSTAGRKPEHSPARRSSEHGACMGGRSARLRIGVFPSPGANAQPDCVEFSRRGGACYIQASAGKST